MGTFLVTAGSVTLAAAFLAFALALQRRRNAEGMHATEADDEVAATLYVAP